jgi:hypothetical protein
MKTDVNRKALVNFMINDDIDGLAEYIKQLINVSCEDSYNDGYAEGYHDACMKEDY